jgi:hypothetical protein
VAALPPPVVVELFASQGCDSCPPADAVLGELGSRPDVLPLTYHVTHWDRPGWPDTFGLEASTERQRDYAGLLARDGLYTPQMVIGGRIDVVGSQRERVHEAIELLTAHRRPGLPIAIEDGRLRLGAGPPGDATIWLFGVDLEHEVWIQRGENRGRVIRSAIGRGGRGNRCSWTCPWSALPRPDVTTPRWWYSGPTAARFSPRPRSIFARIEIGGGGGGSDGT